MAIFLGKSLVVSSRKLNCAECQPTLSFISNTFVILHALCGLQRLLCDVLWLFHRLRGVCYSFSMFFGALCRSRRALWGHTIGFMYQTRAVCGPSWSCISLWIHFAIIHGAFIGSFMPLITMCGPSRSFMVLSVLFAVFYFPFIVSMLHFVAFCDLPRSFAGPRICFVILP